MNGITPGNRVAAPAVVVDRRWRKWASRGPRDRRVTDLPILGPDRRRTDEPEVRWEREPGR